MLKRASWRVKHFRDYNSRVAGGMPPAAREARAMDSHELERLIADCHRTLLDFLQADLKMGMTYVHIALRKVSDGDMPGAERGHKQAQKAFETILKFLPRLSAQDAQERKQIECGLAELKKLLAESADLIPGLHT